MTAALTVAFLWGLAEATVFFIVPDVFLTFLARRGLRPAMTATAAALAGALVGGVVMFAAGTRSFLEHVPGIHASLVATVHDQIARQGIIAVLIGPLRGIPYKIYAVEWPAHGGGLAPFLAISVPARWLRFAGSVLVARGGLALAARWTHREARREVAALAAFWCAFYAWYFAHFGW